MHTALSAAPFLLGCLLGGCGGSPAAPDAVTVSGTWDATFEGIVQGAGTTQTDDVMLQLDQTGTRVSGFLRFSPNFEAIDVPIVEGRVDGRRLTYSAVTTLGNCELRADAELSLDPSGTRLNGSQTQSNCEGTAVGQITATRRPPPAQAAESPAGRAAPASPGRAQLGREAPPLVRAPPLWFPGTPLLAVQVTRLAREIEPVQSQSNSQQPEATNWIKRHPKLFGALVGFGAGCAVGASQVGGSQDDFFNALDEFACPAVGGIGAGVGAVIGWAVSRAR